MASKKGKRNWKSFLKLLYVHVSYHIIDIHNIIFSQPPSSRVPGIVMWKSPLIAMTLAFSIWKSNSFLLPRGSVILSNQRFKTKSLFFLGFSTMSTSSTTIGAHEQAPSSLNVRKSESTTKITLEEVSPSYKQLLEKLRTLTQLKRVSGLLDYDQMVMMPQSDDTAQQRGLQQSALATIIHEKATEPVIRELYEQSLKDLDTIDDNIHKNRDERILKLAKKSYEKKILIPSSLEAKRAQLSSSAYSTWVKAREAKDFNLFSECLEDCFSTAKELASALQTNDTVKKSLYTQMLDEYEMGMDGARIDEIFAAIETALKPLIAEIFASEHSPSTLALQGNFDIEKQKEVNKEIITRMGFDLNHGRIDQSVHPFTMSLGPADVRITSRFKTTEWYQGLAGTIHEGGHAMYEQNLGKEDLEIDEFLSMGMHESQSLFWERHVGMSEEFCKWLTPVLKEAFGDGFVHSFKDVYGAMNAVAASPIRVEADELTYPLHVILRYNIERDVVEGRLDVKDIPKRWNDEMKAMLNIDIDNDALGCLQDVHWSGLAIGYFPTYLIGSATAAQLAYYCHKDNPDMYQNIEKGEFGSIKAWLNDKVHRHGKRYDSLDCLLKDQVGEALNPQYFINYLTMKYKALYKC